MDMFDTRTMIEALEEMKPAQTFLKDRYFSNTVESVEKKVDIDIYVGKRRIAPFVHPKLGSKTVERTGYKTESYEPPQVAPDMITTAEDLQKRGVGENVYNAKSPDQRAQEQLGKDLAELDDMITRREEVMCAEALFSGQVTVEGEGYSDTVQYWSQLSAPQKPYLALGAGDRWNEGTADISADFRAARLDIIQKSGVNPRDALLGRAAAEALLSNEAFKKNLDYRRIDTGAIDPQLLPNGVTYWGYMKDSGLDLWSYDEWYVDPETGLEVPMVPEKKVLIGSDAVRTSMMYGCVIDVEHGSFAKSRVPVSFMMRKPQSGRVLQMFSKPLPVIHQLYGFKVLEVLA